jgi:2-dehydropantoate 2-reductase
VKIVIVGGGGAMGGVWASRLQAAGQEVAILDVSPEALAAINGEGLVVERKDGSTTVTRLPASDDAAALGLADAIIFFTKAHHTRAAAERARPLVAPATTVVSLQNGWGNSDTLATVFPAAQIVMGVTYHSATLRAPGRVAHTNDVAPTIVGPYADGAALDRANAVAAAMEAATIATTVTGEVKREVWKKVILNCATLPTASLSRLTAGDLGQPGPLLDLVDAIAVEATAVAKGLGYDVDPAERIATIHEILGKAGKGKP